MDMPFRSMVNLMAKWVLASVPALILLAAIVSAIGIFAMTLFSSLASQPRMF